MAEGTGDAVVAIQATENGFGIWVSPGLHPMILAGLAWQLDRMATKGMVALEAQQSVKNQKSIDVVRGIPMGILRES